MNFERRDSLEITLGTASAALSGNSAWGAPAVKGVAAGVSLVHGPVN